MKKKKKISLTKITNLFERFAALILSYDSFDIKVSLLEHLLLKWFIIIYYYLNILLHEYSNSNDIIKILYIILCNTYWIIKNWTKLYVKKLEDLMKNFKSI